MNHLGAARLACLLVEVWTTPPVSVDSGKGRRGNKQCWTARPPRLPNVAERMQHQQNRRQKGEMSRCSLFSSRRKNEVRATGELWVRNITEQWLSERTALCYQKGKKAALSSCWLRVGGSEVFPVLVYEVYGLDWPIEWHWTRAQEAASKEPQPDLDSFVDVQIHRKTAPFGRIR